MKNSKKIPLNINVASRRVRLLLNATIFSPSLLERNCTTISAESLNSGLLQPNEKNHFNITQLSPTIKQPKMMTLTSTVNSVPVRCLSRFSWGDHAILGLTYCAPSFIRPCSVQNQAPEWKSFYHAMLCLYTNGRHQVYPKVTTNHN